MGGAQSDMGGFRIFKVQPGSPAMEGGLEVFFDFIIDVDGVKMEADQKHFFDAIKGLENKNAKLVVYNCRSNTVRDVYVTPRKWGGVGLLGATVRWDGFDKNENQGIRVLEVFPNSPASQAGMVAYQDYLLGTQDLMFHEIDELVDLISVSLNRRIILYVYNSDTELVREVALVPNNDWGDAGAIGCDIGQGVLHRIPVPRRPVGKTSTPGGSLPPPPPPALAPGGSSPPPPPPVLPAAPSPVSHRSQNSELPAPPSLLPAAQDNSQSEEASMLPVASKEAPAMSPAHTESSQRHHRGSEETRALPITKANTAEEFLTNGDTTHKEISREPEELAREMPAPLKARSTDYAQVPRPGIIYESNDLI